ncbi:MAG: hypothetical protein D6744_13115 [Planctomycetota bacterium]|nr:MAG: hypothetical protein D6744_13115 [Planctomycetota bacterium]
MKEQFSFDDLIHYAAGDLDETTSAAVEAYLRGAGARHAGDIRRIRAAIQTMRTDDSRDPSPAAIERYKAIFKRAAATNQPESWLEGAVRVVASLLFDSRSAPATAGYRGAGQAVQLAFESDAADIEMELEPVEGSDGARWHVTGQVTTDEPPNIVRIGCCRPGEETPVVVAAADPHGGFSFEIERGAYNLIVRVDDRVVVIEDFRVE